MDLRAILNDVQDDEGPPAKGEAEPAQITETRHGLPRLLRLPAALHNPIISHLSNRDIKSLRLTCSFFHGIARFRLHRVFVSAHLRDIQVLHAIADSDTFRAGVAELIWDDARLRNPPRLVQAHDGGLQDGQSQAADEHDDHEVPRWFVDACNENIEDLDSRRGSDADNPEHAALAEQLGARLPASTCWVHYQELLRQQEAVLASGADEAAFRYALQRFPSLERVTITPAAHGRLFSPLYETPTVRALPRGFNYPMPRGWPGEAEAEGEGEAHEDQRRRGARIALRVLAETQTEHQITELALDGGGGRAGHHDHVPLGGFLPVDVWPRLRHFRLSGFLVTQGDVVSLLRGMPGSLRSVELSFLRFADGGGDLRGLLRKVRDALGWRERGAGCRPDVVVGHALAHPRLGRAVWAGPEAVGGFLYGDGPNPFGEEGDPGPNQIVMGDGVGVERDAFDP